MNALLVFIGGGIGSLVRFALSQLIGSSYVANFPLATLIANVISSTILALTMVYVSTKMSDSTWVQPLIMIGFCGGFSTFSTFSAETVELIQSGNNLMAIINVVVSVGFGIGLVYYILNVSK